MTDNAILYSATICCLALILFSFRYGRGWAALHLLVFIMYTCYGYYGLYEWSRGQGNALVWWFYLLLAQVLQIVILLVRLVIRARQSRS